ncbi:hypothetical protein [Dactylosporangium sp. NPDC051484]|uniref:hypothetical protein n=1 Tax=Dactylosporangium sp. NPDC051484 TaxID=3154942 RepID=UPI00344F2F6E
MRRPARRRQGEVSVEGVALGAVHEFVAGRLDDAGQAALADQIAALIGQPKPPSTPIASALRRVMQHVGGDEELLAWLDRFPGRPQLIARVLGLVALLDRFGDRLAVVSVLRELRERAPYPKDLAGHLPAVTDEETLPGLSGEIKMLLGEDDLADAGRVALAGATLLTKIAPRVADVPGVEGLGSPAERSRQGLEEALRALEEVR